MKSTHPHSLVSAEDFLLKPNLKASERVRLFIESQLRNSKLRVGDRLPASRVLANHLHVSITTVQTVLRDLAADGIIRTTVGSGSYLNAPISDTKVKNLRIGLSFGTPHPRSGGYSGMWSMAISGAIMRAASGFSSPVSIHPTQIADGSLKDILDALKRQEGKVDAMILHPLLDGFEVAAREADLAYPIVHLNPGFTTASTNFISSDFYAISHRLGSVWASTGRRRILFIHNSGEQMNASAALRCFGLVAGLGNKIGNEIHFRVVSGDSHLEQAGYELAKTTIGKIPPDAIYLVGDALAIGFCRYLSEMGLKIPEEVSVVAGTGIAEHAPYSDLTRTRQPVEKIGEALLEMACTLVESEEAELPGKYLPCSFIGGRTTREEENTLLHLVDSAHKDPFSPLRTGGFTLVEYLIVIAILAVFIVLTFPAFVRVMEYSRSVTCMGNLKSIGSAAYLYAGDHNDFLPGMIYTRAEGDQPIDTHGGEQWDVQIMPYLGMQPVASKANTKTAFYCPASKPYPTPMSRQLSYAWNGRITEDAPTYSRKLSSLSQPSTILLATDNKIESDQPDRNTVTFGSASNTIYINDNPSKLKRVAYERHSGKVNVLFADGSVSTRQPVSADNPTPQHVRFYSGGPLSAEGE